MFVAEFESEDSRVAHVYRKFFSIKFCKYRCHAIHPERICMSNLKGVQIRSYIFHLISSNSTRSKVRKYYYLLYQYGIHLYQICLTNHAS
ncbi:hypothetical protein M486_4197 (plasmid) [Yersinia pestis 1045]|uniref:Uncharacterized protein n=2 Tax=Yersinia pestis TaxID=632 RepID=A0A1U8QHQ0_YERPE|nr:unknown [Yersinia pestis KIM10+]AAS58711.1 hypothetical protein YP_pMT079 [Yersinia pestis biovar Microtus str. 91001]ADW01163.1 hypothetical protein YPC_4835 [Yersinia pestis biovar Medievalis str. Harbin 35]AJJ81934.1 hypothetical protein CH56_4229 [Yersinia pestis Angola]AKB86298.1 hypothetical protein CH44_4252 [Yersinia pestis]AKT04162.1 hypothetical protein M486_4197 [Yersinia pestis 1045]EEO74287.1 hypothetical protein YP516_4707 [Yersinia pestis Nepal516]EEO83444.1 hypothetical pr